MGPGVSPVGPISVTNVLFLPLSFAGAYFLVVGKDGGAEIVLGLSTKRALSYIPGTNWQTQAVCPA